MDFSNIDLCLKLYILTDYISCIDTFRVKTELQVIKKSHSQNSKNYGQDFHSFDQSISLYWLIIRITMNLMKALHNWITF